MDVFGLGLRFVEHPVIVRDSLVGMLQKSPQPKDLKCIKLLTWEPLTFFEFCSRPGFQDDISNRQAACASLDDSHVSLVIFGFAFARASLFPPVSPILSFAAII